MSFTHYLRKMKRNRLHLVTTGSILALMLSATTSLVCAQSGSRETRECESKFPKQMSFEGYFQGGENDTLQGTPPDAILVDGKVTGIATHLGQFTLTYTDRVKLPEGSATGEAELIAANGDRLFLSLIGQGVPIDTDIPTLNSIVEINTITGGTGRFLGATGAFTTLRLVDIATGFTSGSVHGTIVFPQPSRRDH